MILQPIDNKAMWAIYNPLGCILYFTIGHTKEEAQKHYRLYGSKTLEAALKLGYTVSMIAVDIKPIEL